MQFHIESLLSARLFLSPQLAGGRLYFLSDLGGRISLYAMDATGGIPEPLLPRGVALQNPILMDGESFFVFPKLGKVLVMIDKDGDENYQPMFVPLEGGVPEPVFGDRFAGQQVVCEGCDPERNLTFFRVDPRDDPFTPSYLVDLSNRTLTDLGSTKHGNFLEGHNTDYTKLIIGDNYLAGDRVIYLWDAATGQRRVLFGVLLEDRAPGQQVPMNSIHSCHFTDGDRGLIFITSLFDDHYGLGYFRLDAPQDVRPVPVTGTTHSGLGEMEGLEHLHGDRYLLTYNIDGVSYAYEGVFDETSFSFHCDRRLCGSGPLSNGMIQKIRYTKEDDAYALAFATATSPAQIFTLTGSQPHGPERAVCQITHERTLGIPSGLLSPGEDYPYTSHDGLRISSRLYLPAAELGYEGPRPVVFYIHGGPQGQERPDFAWFSMPLIQFLTLNGLAVWVPNVRGSTGYGLDYMSRVDRDWGGLDRLDHVAAFDVLRRDPRVDVTRAGVVGRSYGGYMTLTLAGRHPDLWRAAVDMFGPYNLFTFMERLPDAWRTHFYMSIGDPATDHDEIVSRSPDTYIDRIACPLLVIQGRNDPRVVEAESRDLVERLRGQGKEVEFLVFENEGHDVIKAENKVKCYNEITRFFVERLCA